MTGATGSSLHSEYMKLYIQEYMKLYLNQHSSMKAVGDSCKEDEPPTRHIAEKG